MEKENKQIYYINVKEGPGRIFTIECEPNKEIKYLRKSIYEYKKSCLDDIISYHKEQLAKNPTDTFNSKYLEKEVKERNEISYDNIRLFSKGQELDDDKKFVDYSIIATDGYSTENRSMLDMRVLYNLRVYVSITNMETDLLYFFKGNDSIKSLKEKISENENIPIDKMTLIFNGNNIREEVLFKDLNVNELYFKVILEGEQIIEINLYEGNNCSKCKVDLFSSVYQNQFKINKHLNYRLSFQGKLLNLRKLLIHYKIKDGDSLELIKTDKIILINTEYIGEKFIKSKFHFDINETLKDFKNDVFAKIKEDNFYIHLYGRKIFDNKKIKEYDISEDIILTLTPPLLGG